LKKEGERATTEGEDRQRGENSDIENEKEKLENLSGATACRSRSTSRSTSRPGRSGTRRLPMSSFSAEAAGATARSK
jgi:hypothetical protein